MSQLKIDPDIMTGEKPLNGNNTEPPAEVSELVKKFRSNILDQNKDYPAPEAVMFIRQKGEKIPLLTLKSFSLWQGKQKSKKTTALAVLIAAFIADFQQMIADDETYLQPGETGVVLFFDTEQGESYAARTMRLILKMAGLETSPRLKYINLTEETPNERMKLIAAGIEDTPGTRLVVIDGLVDLLNDFMDAGDGQAVITELRRLCSKFNIHIAGVLHQNKADKNARAHIGSIASQKSEVEISTEVDPEDRSQSIVSCVNSRDLPFEPFVIRWGKGELPRINNECDISQRESKQSKPNRYYTERKRISEQVFKPLAALRHTDAKNEVVKAANCSERTAIRMIKDMETFGFIEQGADSLYRAKLPVVTSDK